MKKRTKNILLALAGIFVVIQFIHPSRNVSKDETYAVSTKYAVPDDVKAILKVACNDCHSNYTDYPWYASVQPSAWWLSNHVNEGKEHLNLSKFTNRPVAVQNHQFDELIEMVKEKEMPLGSYTWLGLHPGANLTDEQRAKLTAWALANMEFLKATYPADSLVLKRPKR
ncbi:MAG: heme-binding domain-containing protein [Bacteroidetes bacterium]|nr:heme-binding domain-containing protein [Bacteroidota bacterium]